MIRKLCIDDNEKVMEFLKNEKTFNLFFISDIENYKYETEFQDVWGEIDNKGELKGILLRYFKNFLFYGIGDYSIEGISEIVTSHEGFESFSCKQEIMEKFMPYIKGSSINNAYLAEMKCIEENSKYDFNIRKADENDIERLVDIRRTIEEFQVISTEENYRKVTLQTLNSKTGRIYYIEKDGKIVSTAGTSAENKEAAMIVAVCTREGYRKNGYAAACVQKLCRDLLAEGKTPALFYVNPEAARIYKKVGFKDIGYWSILTGKREERNDN